MVVENVVENGQSRVRLCLVDDPTAIACLRSVLDSEPDLEIVDTYNDWWQALSVLSKAAADISVLDVTRPGLDADLALRRFRQVCPAVKIIAMVDERDRRRLEIVESAPISGYLLKRRAGSDLVPMIRRVHQAPVHSSEPPIALFSRPQARWGPRTAGPSLLPVPPTQTTFANR